jgi:hypothetical protein
LVAELYSGTGRACDSSSKLGLPGPAILPLLSPPSFGLTLNALAFLPDQM